MVVLSGVQVAFPFPPYPSQIDYMEKVIQALQTGQHALLESPTGTGKTLCLLCSTLAWRQSFIAKCQLDASLSKRQSTAQNYLDTSVFQGLQENLSRAAGNTSINPVTDDSLQSGDTLTVDQLLRSFGGNDNSNNNSIRPIPRIIFTSRTHSQLAQAIGQLKKTVYRPRTIILGSREQLCIHPQVSQARGSEQNRLCRSLCESKGCKYRNNLKHSNLHEKVEKEILDLEDLVLLGKKEQVCPYYLSKEMEPSSEIIFLPYNYLVDPHLKESLHFDFSNDIILFDEAHHIEDIAASCASFTLSVHLWSACIHQLQRVFQSMRNTEMEEENSQHSSKDSVSLLLALFRALFDEWNHLLEESSAEEELVREPSFLFQLLSKVNVTSKTVDKLLSKIDQLFGENQHPLHSPSTNDALEGSPNHYSNDAIFTFQRYMRLLFQLSEEQANLSYVVCIYREGKSRGTTLSCWCFDPSLVMKQLVKGIRCLILTSGTLGPLPFLESELQLPFPIQLENRHIIDANQLLVGTIQAGPSGQVLNSNWRNRNSTAYKRELGRCIYNFSLVIPGGILVFFPSYQVMMDCVEYWKTCGMQSDGRGTDTTTIWDSIGRRKFLVVESKEDNDFHETFRLYQQQMDNRACGGGILFGVCRGRMSEGIDFSDDYARAVVMVGIPFPPLHERKVRMKQHYLSHVKKDNALAQRWYRLEAIRAVNQAIGRVIRHEKDFGAIILCDERFCSMSHQLSRWIQPFVRHYSFGQLQSNLHQFFKRRVSGGKKRSEQGEVSSNGLRLCRYSKMLEVLSSSSPKKTPKLSAGDEAYLFQAMGMEPISKSSHGNGD